MEKELEAGDEIEKNIEALSAKKSTLEATLEKRKQEMGDILMAHDNQLKQMKEVFDFSNSLTLVKKLLVDLL